MAVKRSATAKKTRKRTKGRSAGKPEFEGLMEAIDIARMAGDRRAVAWYLGIMKLILGVEAIRTAAAKALADLRDD